MNIIPHSHRSEETTLAVLAPKTALVPNTFFRTKCDPQLHRSLLDGLQRLRGSAYSQDGAISPRELTADGRHAVPLDEKSWHVLCLDRGGEVVGCLRFSEESGANYEHLWVGRAAVARCPKWGGRFRRAIESRMAWAGTEGLRFGEVGGWAITEARRGTLDAVRIILATYGLLQLLGGCLGVATATLRHESARILRRLGLKPITVDGAPIPEYYDEHYGCQMQVLEFDSRYPNAKYVGWVRERTAGIGMAPVVCAETAAQPLFTPVTAGSFYQEIYGQA
jgi:hypothetical protein